MTHNADYLARVAAIAERERAKDASTREAMRALHPGAAAAHDWALPVFGRPAWVRDCQTGYEAGRHLPDRRNVVVPPIPGVSR